MKKILSLTILAMTMLTASAATITDLWITGSAVPCGTQKLEVFPNQQFKYFGRLNAGELYIINTPQITSETSYLCVRNTDQSIEVTDLRFTAMAKDTYAMFKVLTTADDYRLTINLNNSTLTTEHVVPWADLNVVGGAYKTWATEGNVPWGEMTQDAYDPYSWTWVGELKENECEEPRRIKLVGQRGWGPKSIHPFVQDESLLTSTQCQVVGSPDYKWEIADNGYYRIRVNVFHQTFECTYLGKDLNSVKDIKNNKLARISVSGGTISVDATETVDVKVYDTKGVIHNQRRGNAVRISGLTKGTYIIEAKGFAGEVRKKVSL